MRPIQRGISPQSTEFKPYTGAQQYLVSRLGLYCSYCERVINTSIAVEHVQPKGLPAYAHLIGTWTNYLLACVNCNSTKGSKPVVLADVLLPDRDNTFLAFSYLPDGRVIPSAAAIVAGVLVKARDTLALTGLDKASSTVLDENGKEVALDRVAQRSQAWMVALEAKSDVDKEPTSQLLRKTVATLARTSGFFSIWMTVFEGDVDMRNRLVDAFGGTRGSGCFDPATADGVSPAPNPDNLPDGSKI